MELYNSRDMPLSTDQRLRAIQEKILHGEALTFSDKILVGRDHPVKQINGYQLKPDHAYRVISEKMFEIYKEKGIYWKIFVKIFPVNALTFLAVYNTIT